MGMALALRSWLADNMAAGVFSRSRVRSESLHSASLSATSQLRSRTFPYAWLPFPFHSSTDLAIPRTSYSNTSAVVRLVLLPTLFQFKHTYMQRRLWLHDLILPLREQLLPQLFRLRAMQLQLVRVRNMVRLLSKQWLCP